MKISIIAPMYNEEENIESTLNRIKQEMIRQQIEDFEVIFVNDGSTDNSWEVAKKLEKKEHNLKVIGYSVNQGRGKALRTGFDYATGDIIVTVDFDLSYDETHIGRMIKLLAQNPMIDIVLVSVYMKGGMTIGVSPFRLWISKLGNFLFRYAFTQRIYTSTCVVRAYRNNVIKSLVLNSDDKEIHLEIISKALANNYKIVEIPGILTKRKKGKSKFKFKVTSISHILFLIHEKPFFIFGIIGLVLFIVGFLAAIVLVYTRFGNDVNFNMTLLSRVSSPSTVLLLFLFSLQFIALGFLGVQNSFLKRELFRIQTMLKRNEKQKI